MTVYVHVMVNKLLVCRDLDSKGGEEEEKIELIAYIIHRNLTRLRFFFVITDGMLNAGIYKESMKRSMFLFH
jgi:hypothetical protein